MPNSLDHFRNWLQDQPPQRSPHLEASDFLAALQIWMLVFTATLPLVVPFLLIDSPHSAVRASQAIAVVLMFARGVGLGRWIGARPWVSGLACAVIGIAIAAAWIALGG